jgi:hypothetical protein
MISAQILRHTAYEDASDRAHALLAELWATITLLRLSRVAWSPTLKAQAVGLTERKQELELELHAMRAWSRLESLSIGADIEAPACPREFSC